MTEKNHFGASVLDATSRIVLQKIFIPKIL